jgi:hypothetical protein
MLVELIMLYPFLFNFIIIFYFIKSYNLEIAFYYYFGLFLTLGITFVMKFLIFSNMSEFDFVSRKDVYIDKNKNKKIDLLQACNIIEAPFARKIGVASLYTAFYGYIISYFVLGDTILNVKSKISFSSAIKMVSIIIMTITHSFFQYYRGCTSSDQIFLGLLIGLIIGIFWINVIGKHKWDYPDEYGRTLQQRIKYEKKCIFRGNKYICEDDVKEKELEKCVNITTDGKIENDIYNNCKKKENCVNVGTKENPNIRCKECEKDDECNISQKCENSKCIQKTLTETINYMPFIIPTISIVIIAVLGGGKKYINL